MRTGRRLIQDYWGILLILVAWQAWVIVNQFNPIVMPTPISVFDALVTDPVLFLENTGITFAVALVGMTGGMIIGTSLAVATWLSPLLSGLVSPLAVLFSSVPVVALIPIIARLLGYNVSTEIAIVVIITFFPSFVFASSGLRALPPGSDDLFRVLGASRRATLFRLALPAAMPNLAIALRLAAAHAILAAMIAEFLMGTSGLGYLFAKTNDEFQTEQAFGTSIVATAISVAAFLLASFVERRVRVHFS
ncbi:MAG: ABC transporter permease subunit [Rhodospirillaceae bacterium]|nr:ABC transporter permease subunit [Rhodospirillaceae bacterium]MYH35916.1 ABC transporter permease subunit [Rhodospirillaceae bacterium]MYK13997.1 ABC transporter permease subunit [Rhodospirillaceae bacterium]